MDTQIGFGTIFKDVPVLITGHTGFKGSWLSIWFNELGAKVIGYSRDSKIEPRNFELCRLRDKIEHHEKGDIRDLDRMLEVFRDHKPEVVIHLAAQPLVRVSYEKPKETIDLNVGGTVNVLEAIRQTQSVKVFIGVTTDKVYEDQQWDWSYRENDRLGGYDPYSASKAMAEQAIQSYRSSWSEPGFSSHNLAIASARAGNVIGGGDFSKSRLVPGIMKALMEGREYSLHNPEAIRPWQYVLEPLSGYIWLAANLYQKHNEFNGAWNLGPLEYQVITCEILVKKIIELWGNGSYKSSKVSSKPHETAVLRLDSSKAAKHLAWCPTYTWEEALSETIEWFKAYQHRLSKQTEIDMYYICVRQIERYVDQARKKKVKWVSP